MAEIDAPGQHDSLPGVNAPVLTRKLAGHDKQALLLASSYRTGRLHHALMFEGPAGIGKASMAFQFAQHLIGDPEARQAPEHLALLDAGSDEFRQMANGTHLQVMHLTRPFDPKAEKFKTVLSVEEIRRINHFLSMTNIGKGFRVIIIDPVNDMNASAANALLKNLEEPPARTLFILIAHAAGRVLPTIRSRCQSLQFGSLNDSDLKEAVKQASADFKASNSEPDRMARLSDGSVRRALMLIGFGGLEVTESADRIIEGAVFNSDKAQKLGDAMTARDADIQYQLLIDHLLQKVARAATRHAAQDDVRRAAALAQFHGETRQALIEAQSFNLDRKQTIFGLLVQMQQQSSAGLL